MTTAFTCACPLRLIAFVAAIAAAGVPAHAQIDVEVGAQHGVAWSDGRVFSPPVTRAWGYAYASQATSGSFGAFGTGPAPCASIVCPPGPTVGGGDAGAIARADATQMNLGVRAWGSGGLAMPQSAAEVQVTDFLSTTGFGTLSFEVHLDLSLLVSAVPGAQGRYGFSFTTGSGDLTAVPFAFIAERRFTSQGQFLTSALVLLNDGATVIDLGNTIPSTYTRTLDLLFTPGSTRLQMVASATAEGPIAASSSVDVDAYSSAWLGIDGNFVSANGYAYPAFVPVPEPRSALLIALGLAAFASRGLRSRR